MLNNNNDIYKMCPIFKHIVSREPEIGDFVLSYCYLSLVIDKKYDENCGVVYKTFALVSASNDKSNVYYRDYTIELFKRSQNYIVISKELGNFIIKNLSSKEYKKIYDIVWQKNDEDCEEIYYIYMFLYRLYTYFNSIVSDDIDKMILLSFGIEKVLKKHKNNGFRDVLLGNGQVWRLKKRKAKGMLRKKIISTNINIDRNESYKKKLKTVHYSIVKRLDKNETIIP